MMSKMRTVSTKSTVATRSIPSAPSATRATTAVAPQPSPPPPHPHTVAVKLPPDPAGASAGINTRVAGLYVKFADAIALLPGPARISTVAVPARPCGGAASVNSAPLLPLEATAGRSAQTGTTATGVVTEAGAGRRNRAERFELQRAPEIRIATVTAAASAALHDRPAGYSDSTRATAGFR